MEYIFRAVTWPLRHYYFSGPFPGLGGRDAADVCSQMGGGSGAFWAENAEECDRILEKRYGSFMAAAQLVVIGFVAHRLFSVVCFKYLVAKPAIKEFKEALKGACSPEEYLIKCNTNPAT